MLPTADFWAYIGIWSLIGSAGFSLLLVIAIATNVLRLVRDENAELRNPMPLSGWLVLVGFILTATSFPLIAAYVGLVSRGMRPDFWQLFLMNFLIFIMVSFYDTFIIDILILVFWHPDFLNLPDSEAFNSAIYHIKTLIPATAFSLVFSLISSLIAWLVFF
jgi:hypothetical protein